MKRGTEGQQIEKSSCANENCTKKLQAAMNIVVDTGPHRRLLGSASVWFLEYVDCHWTETILGEGFVIRI